MNKSFRIVSDLHLNKNNLKQTLKKLNYYQNNKYVNNLILAGDITIYNKINLLNNLFNELTYYNNIIYVLGNHEYIGTKFRTQLTSDSQVINNYKLFCQKYNNVTILENNSININGINIYGSTFWTDHLKPIKQNYSINIKQSHNDSKKILNTMNKQDIIVTHYVPSHSLVVENEKFGISSQSDYLLSKTKYWIYGHIHTRQIKTINQTLTICNPLCKEDYILEV